MADLSIVICTRNRASKLAPMLAALKQVRSDRDWEALIINNASTDNAADILAHAEAAHTNLRVALVERIGLGAARDAGWRLAKGNIILFTDDDCYVAPDIVDAVLAVFEERPDVGYVGGKVLLHDPTDHHITTDERDAAEDIAPFQFIRAGVLLGANFAFRRSTMEAIGGFDPELGAGTPFPCEDIDAISAAAWAGYHGRYDPTIVVRHHHGRKAADAPALREAYDRGRGAYYAKYIMRLDSRSAFLKGWYATARETALHSGLGRVRRELSSAFRYMRLRKFYAGLIFCAIVVPWLYLWLGALRALGKVLPKSS